MHSGIESPPTIWWKPAHRAEKLWVAVAFGGGTGGGSRVVEPPAGSDIYLMAMMWSWRPVLRLQKGAEYTLHLSSLDVNHGFGLLPLNINVQGVPGYDYGLRVTPTETGDLRIVGKE